MGTDRRPRDPREDGVEPRAVGHPAERRALADRLPERAEVADQLGPPALAGRDALGGRGADLAHLDEPLEHLDPGGLHVGHVEGAA